MPRGSTPDPAKPRRDLLADVFKDQDLLRRVERLFEVGGQETPDSISSIETTLTEIVTQKEIVNELVKELSETSNLFSSILETGSQLIESKKELENISNETASLRETLLELKKVVEENELSPKKVTNIIDENLPIPKALTDFIEMLNVGTELLAGYVESGNYFKTEGTGFQESFGNARNWDDVYPSAVSLGRGASAPVSTAYFTGTNFDFLAPVFPSSAPAKEITLHFQIYHSYDEGTDIETHIHLYIPDDGTGGDIVFDYEYYWANIGDTGTPSTTTGSATITRAASAGIAQNHLMEIKDVITGTGKKISSILSITLSRDTSDSFGSSVWLLSDDCHIRRNTAGSRQEATK